MTAFTCERNLYFLNSTITITMNTLASKGNNMNVIREFIGACIFLCMIMKQHMHDSEIPTDEVSCVNER